MIGKIIAGVLGGIIPAILGGFLVIISFPLSESSGNIYTTAFFVVWGAALTLAIIAERPAKAWRRMFVTSGILALCLPLASMIFTGNVASEAAAAAGEHANAAVAGAALGGGLVVIFQ